MAKIKTQVKHRIHRTIAIIVVPLLIISTATGFFKANQKWYWEDGYKKKKHPSAFVIDKELFPVSKLVLKIDSLSGKKNKFEELNIITENEGLYYKVATGSKERYLIDAYSGNIVSPISTELASAFAAQYVKEKPKVLSCELLKDYMFRKSKEPKPAYKVMFDNAVHSEIYLDQQTGEIIEDIDDNRHFGIWVMRLHEYDFFNSKRGITSFVGILIAFVALTGIWIYRRRSKKKKEDLSSQ